MRVDHGQPQVEGPLAGASTSGPTTKDEAAEPHCLGGPAGESTGPASWLSPQSDAQQGAYVPLSELRAADRVEVWSQTARSWFPAVVTRVHHDDTLEVAYRNDQGRERWNDLPRYHPALRPFRPMPGVG